MPRKNWPFKCNINKCDFFGKYRNEVETHVKTEKHVANKIGMDDLLCELSDYHVSEKWVGQVEGERPLPPSWLSVRIPLKELSNVNGQKDRKRSRFKQ